MINNIAIIPARGGSKRIPGKNIKPFHGKPIIAYSIQVALDAGIFEKVMVSTDDPRIAEIAVKYGACVPFLRSPETSDDFTGTAEVILEVLNRLKEEGYLYSNVCCIYPTAPLLEVNTILKAFNHMREKNFFTVFPVCEFSYPIWRSLKIDADGRTHLNFPENQDRRSQDLPPSYHDAGQFYWLDVKQFWRERQIFGTNSGVIKLSPLQVQDIDNYSDWVLAELKYQLLRSKSE